MKNLEASTHCITLFMSGDYARCAAETWDIVNSGKAPESIFQILLICLQRLGLTDELNALSTIILEQTERHFWVNSLLKLTLGKVEPQALFQSAQNPSQRCAVLYYTGARLKTLGYDEEARIKFKECAEMGGEDLEMLLARAELNKK